MLRFSVRFEKLSQPKIRNRFELVYVKNALGGIFCPKCFFHPQKLNLFWFCLGLKSVLETFSFKMKIAMWLFFPLYVFFLCMYHAEYKHLRWYQLCHDYVIKKSDLFSIKSHKHCPHLEAFDFERCHHLKYFWHVPFLSFRQWTPPDHWQSVVGQPDYEN